MRDYAAAPQIEPTPLRSQANGATALIHLNAYRRALDDSAAVLERQPDHEIMRLVQPEANLRLEAWSAALSAAGRLIALDPELRLGYAYAREARQRLNGEADARPSCEMAESLR